MSTHNKNWRPALLSDVDGVVADMVGGFRKFVNETYALDFNPNDVVYHNDMGRSPLLKDIDSRLEQWFPEGGISGAFNCFMRDANVYGRWIDPIDGAIDAISQIRKKYDVVFVTALMKSARDHFRSKMEWIERWFPGISIITCPSGDKFRVRGYFAVDDRWDTCKRWTQNHTPALLFKQPWNESPDDVTGVGWSTITDIVMSYNE